MALALTAAVLAPVQAAAAATPAAMSFAKSEAILGGAPSRLAVIIAQQQGAPAPVATVPAALTPASYARPLVRPTILRTTPVAAPAVRSGRPDLFGSVALAVGRTSLDSRWRRVRSAHLPTTAAHYAHALRSRDALARVEAINRYVNHRVQFTDDSRQFGRADQWSGATETLRRGRGDCEDYAITKMQMLRAAGFAPKNLYLVLVKDLVRRADHAVLVVRTADRMLLLDNGTDTVADTETVRDYRPIFSFAATGTWTHGYRRTAPPVALAQTEFAPIVPAANAAGDQRSRSASLLALSTGFSR